MVRLNMKLVLDYVVADPACDFIFNIEAARTQSQLVSLEKLEISQFLSRRADTDPLVYNRYIRLKAKRGPLRVSYQATIDITHHLERPELIAELPVAELPGQVLAFLYPSRYCQSDQLLALASREFGHLPRGYVRVQAIMAWVQKHVEFKSNTSNSNTSALDTLAQGTGVCRDFAHLMIALCRAVNIPARFTTGMDYGASPELGPQDFHAYVEVYLSGRWYIFDPSGTAMPMGFVRIGTGRDAADVAFATIFGSVTSEAPVISIDTVVDTFYQRMAPRHCSEGISTDSEFVRW
ncbi:MAG: transglutaminase family protein [Pedobacter sp.]|nr:transglutaminase family protein [Pedobacter sp.]